MAVSRSVGSEIQRPFAVVIIGGLATSIAVTLFLLPVVYALLARRAGSVGAAAAAEEAT
jgi:cobalt-zinc-cadmium resistance protein CzcA